jgi:hypothetical protein
MTLYEKIVQFEAEIEAGTKRMQDTPRGTYPSPDGSILVAALMVSRALMLLARTNLAARSS